ncbi:MAG: T9SS type A sorting domain-containing protein [Candidatus Marinimicrobia bacterium]|nr:T9SS type A sorting domain-containing protein [Candidatus Neomarinimicrobiota bacterium]
MKSRPTALSSLLLLPLLAGVATGQSVTGSYQLTGVSVQYYDVVRDTTGSLAASDSAASYAVTVSWPSSALAAAGKGFTHELKRFVPGDTVAAPATPDGLLSPAGLTAFGIDLSIFLNQETGTFTIPAEGTIPSTFPTIDVENCSTFAVVAQVLDLADLAFSANVVIDSTANSITWGLGIAQSDVFAWFDAFDPAQDPSALHDSVSWGRITAHFGGGDFASIASLTLEWRAIDGADANLGIDENHPDKPLDRVLGIAVLDGDTVTVAALGLNVGSYPILGGSGVDHDVDPSTPNIGIVEDVNWGYLFDPVGDDEILQNGDEPLQFTGYYFTHNFLTAASALEESFVTGFTPTVDTDGDGIPDAPALVVYFLGTGLDLASATIATADSLADLAAQVVALALGLDAPSAGGIGAAVGASVSQALIAYLAGGGMDLPGAIDSTAEVAIVTTLGTLAAAGVTVDDSDHDVDLANLGAGGRLLFEVDNVCIPEQQRQEVLALFDRIILAVESDDSIIPTRFALYANYPNPFNPSTLISFDLPEALATELTIWNLLGQQVRTLYSSELAAGRHQISFDGRDDAGLSMPTGIYFYRVQAERFSSTRKLMLLK